MRWLRAVSSGAIATFALFAWAGSPNGDVSDVYIPNDAERARWTMADMRSLGIALAAHQIDNGQYPRGSLEEMIAEIEPEYIRKAPSTDAWGTSYAYVVSEDRTSYQIVSAGADRTFDESSWPERGEIPDFSGDAILQNGKLVKPWPYR